MATERWLIAGLGNPGKKYEHTWHNLGRMAVFYLGARHGIELKRVRFKGLVGEGVIEGERVVLLAPGTFMNLSGESLAEAMRFYKIPPARVIVLYDDIDLELGMLRIKEQGSAGSHNGMKSVLYHLKTDRFPRIRLGMGPRPVGDMIDIVLSEIPKQKQTRVGEMLADAADAAELILSGEVQRAQERFNHRKGQEPAPERA